MSDQWSWESEVAKQSTVVKSVRAVAVYTNGDRDIVIRQEGYGAGDHPGDEFVVIPRAMANAVIKAIRAELSSKD